MASKPRARAYLWPKTTPPRASPSGTSGRARVTSIPAAVACTHKARPASLPLTPARAALGSPALAPPKGPGWWLVAPAGIPQQPGERLTTPRRDAITRARWRRSGALTHVSVPTGAEDAMRALGRAREEPIGALQAAMLRLTACLLRQDLCSPGRAPWHPAPRRGLRAGDCPTPAPLRVLPEDVRAGTDPTARRPRLAQARPAPGHTWRLQPVVEALQGLRGVPCPVAVTRVAARGDRTRVDTPRPRMRALGLLSADDARGDRRRQGGLPTAGNPHARQARIAGAWASRDPAQVRRQLPL